MLYIIDIPAIIAVPAFLIIGFCALIGLIKAICFWARKGWQKYKTKKEQPYIVKANIYISAHNLFIPTKSTADPKWREATAKLNAEIRRKIKSGEITKEEMDRLEKAYNEKYFKHYKGKSLK